MHTSAQFDRVPYQQLSNEEKIQLQWMYKLGVPLQYKRFESTPEDWVPLTPPRFHDEDFEAITYDVYIRPAPKV
jgi:hypothetical protein